MPQAHQAAFRALGFSSHSVREVVTAEGFSLRPERSSLQGVREANRGAVGRSGACSRPRDAPEVCSSLPDVLEVNPRAQIDLWAARGPGSISESIRELGLGGS